jgi:hypothetical protein
MQQEYPDQVTVPALNIMLRTKGISLREQQLTEYLQAIAAQAPAYLDLSANDVRLNVAPDRVMRELSRQTAELDQVAELLHNRLTAPGGGLIDV